MATLPNLSEFSVHTEKLVEVLYRRYCCSSKVNVSMSCSRVEISTRFSEISSASLFVDDYEDADNENISNDELNLYSDKRKISTTVVGTEPNDETKLYHSESQTIDLVLKKIGLVCCNDKMYTLHPSELYYYKNEFTSYSPKRKSFLLKHDNPVDFCDNYNSVPSRLPYERNFYRGKKKDYYQEQRKHFKGSEIVNQDKKISCRNNKPKNNETLPLKYWSMRYMLFSNFDSGIMLDEESFYSVCPEILSYHIAKRCKNYLALDPFCGAGGNIIQLAFTCELVIAIDIDPTKISFAKHNAKLYGVDDKIEFIVGDIFTISSMLKSDVIFMSPPWGGPDYSNDKFSIETMCDNQFGGGFGIFNTIKNISSNIAFHMPKNTNIFECLWLAKDCGKVEIQQNIIDNKLNSITAFYGDFIDITDNDY